MKTFNLVRTAALTAVGFAVILGATETADAQGNRNNDQRQERRAEQQRQKIEKQQAKIAQQRIQLDRQRQNDWTRRNTSIVIDRSRGNSNYDGNAAASRYRVYRNGSYYNTDNRGAELLRQAVNEGYRQGFEAGRRDRNGRRGVSWSNSNVYRSGSMGYQTHVNRSQYQYYFRQGFQRGYQDGSNSKYQDGYNGQYEYGSNENGSLNILGTILNSVLNLQSY
jgi:hypothetical protein